jgi:hypothetical protein
MIIANALSANLEVAYVYKFKAQILRYWIMTEK